MSNETPLDNPIWHALNSEHRPMARKYGLAARYPTEVARFAGLAHPSPAAFSDLAALTLPGETVALFTAEPLAPPPEWRVVRARMLDQMVCEVPEPDVAQDCLQLGSSDVPEMLALAAATDPGPFAARTIEMGRYLGIRSESRLAAMAGERLRLTSFTEISAVCTDPAFRGRGYARKLVAALDAKISAGGCKPFLHVKTENGAKRVYEALGFKVRRNIALTVLTFDPR
jgi:ribosomal protein S18 acetylase RimI-like enzyme